MFLKNMFVQVFLIAKNSSREEGASSSVQKWQFEEQPVRVTCHCPFLKVGIQTDVPTPSCSFFVKRKQRHQISGPHSCANALALRASFAPSSEFRKFSNK